ncbi:hypothetical protein FB45DRAFT_1062541 [Roridomyces roridus]|uniref:F-box domain-containing protein n=1 Tax=Roridomyces roridus TaxID=1738132 RepID=A0AAD7BG69_9AGAR|nr:hypothetical protein FB45DRAFT_1062541 [Roridomyces roridus]
MDLTASPSSPCRPGLLTSNEPPLDAELPSIRDFLSQEQSTLDALNAHIEQIVLRRDATLESIREHVAVLSPARRVPADVWREIFLFVSFAREVRGNEIPCPPWILGHICRSWREVALCSPLLWNFVEIARPRSKVPLRIQHTYPMSMIQSQLLRASSAPLDVSIDFWHGDTAELALLDQLMSHSHRWRTLNVSIKEESAVTNVLHRFKNVRGRIDQLRTFDISVDCGLYNGEYEEQCDFLSVAPALQQVFLTNRNCLCGPRFNLPWAQIAYYEGTFSKDTQLDILSAARNLIECSLSFPDSCFRSSADASRMVTLLHLRLLRIGVSEERDFLNHLSAPSLQEVQITGELDSLVPFAKRSETLTKLVIQDTYSFNPDTVPGVLQACPNLETLIYIPLEPDSSTFDELKPVWLDSLTVTDPNRDLCPDLRFLGWTWDGEATLEPLLGMIKSRTTSDDWLTVGFLCQTQAQERRVGEKLQAPDILGLDIEVLTVQESEDLVGEWTRFSSHSAPAEFFRKNVHHVLVDLALDDEDAAAVLEGLLKLAVELRSLSLLYSPVNSWTNQYIKPLALLSRFSISQTTMGTIDLTFPVSSSLTHLDFLDLALDPSLLLGLELLPALTHVSISISTVVLSQIMPMLGTCRSLLVWFLWI